MLKGLKSLFFVEVENKKQKGAKKVTREVEPAPPSHETLPEIQEGSPGQVSSKFVDILFRALRQHNKDGFDYMEFRKSLQSLRKMEMDEATRFQSAYAMAETMGVDKEKLIASANFYIDVLKKEEQKFGEALNNQMQKQIVDKKQETTRLEQVIQEKEAVLKKLQQELEQHRKAIAALQQEQEEAAKKIAGTKNDFIASYNSLVNQIRQDMEQIKSFIK